MYYWVMDMPNKRINAWKARPTNWVGLADGNACGRMSYDELHKIAKQHNFLLSIEENYNV